MKNSDAPSQISHSPTGSTSRRWEALRHRVVAQCFGRLFGAVGSRLCEPGQLPTRGIHRVLVCRPNHRLGNAILLSPLLAEIEALYPGSEIDLVCGGGAAEDLFAHRFQVRRVFSLPRKIARHLWLTITLLRQLRSNSYDLAIDACSGSQSGRLLLAFVKARFKLGFPDALGKRDSAWHNWPCPEHLAHRSVFLLRTAYTGKVDRAYPPLNLGLSDSEKQQARQALVAVLDASGQRSGISRPVIGIFANATGAKRYGEDWWKQYVGALRTLKPEVLIVELIAEHGQTLLDGNFASYYTRHLRRLASMIANMDGFISADCGVMHLAVASGTPTLGLFSVTCLRKYGPYGQKNTAIDTETMSASDVAAITAEWLSFGIPTASPPLSSFNH